MSTAIERVTKFCDEFEQRRGYTNIIYALGGVVAPGPIIELTIADLREVVTATKRTQVRKVHLHKNGAAASWTVCGLFGRNPGYEVTDTPANVTCGHCKKGTDW